MENTAGSPPGKRGHVRDWIDPTRLYNIYIPAGRLTFLWGLAIYPLVVIFLFMAVALIMLETFYTGADLPDMIGIVSSIFMLVWLTAAVCICYRRLRDLGRSQSWILLVVLPIVNLIFFLYLLFKPSPGASSRGT